MKRKKGIKVSTKVRSAYARVDNERGTRARGKVKVLYAYIRWRDGVE